MVYSIASGLYDARDQRLPVLRRVCYVPNHGVHDYGGFWIYCADDDRYVVHAHAGVRHQKREAAELAKTSKATQSGVPKDDTSVSATALDNTQRPAPSISSGEGIRTRIINSSA